MAERVSIKILVISTLSFRKRFANARKIKKMKPKRIKMYWTNFIFFCTPQYPQAPYKQKLVSPSAQHTKAVKHVLLWDAVYGISRKNFNWKPSFIDRTPYTITVDRPICNSLCKPVSPSRLSSDYYGRELHLSIGSPIPKIGEKIITKKENFFTGENIEPKESKSYKKMIL